MKRNRNPQCPEVEQFDDINQAEQQPPQAPETVVITDQIQVTRTIQVSQRNRQNDLVRHSVTASNESTIQHIHTNEGQTTRLYNTAQQATSFQASPAPQRVAMMGPQDQFCCFAPTSVAPPYQCCIGVIVPPAQLYITPAVQMGAGGQGYLPQCYPVAGPSHQDQVCLLQPMQQPAPQPMVRQDFMAFNAPQAAQYAPVEPVYNAGQQGMNCSPLPHVVKEIKKKPNDGRVIAASDQHPNQGNNWNPRPPGHHMAPGDMSRGAPANAGQQGMNYRPLPHMSRGAPVNGIPNNAGGRTYVKGGKRNAGEEVVNMNAGTRWSTPEEQSDSLTEQASCSSVETDISVLLDDVKHPKLLSPIGTDYDVDSKDNSTEVCDIMIVYEESGAKLRAQKGSMSTGLNGTGGMNEEYLQDTRVLPDAELENLGKSSTPSSETVNANEDKNISLCSEVSAQHANPAFAQMKTQDGEASRTIEDDVGKAASTLMYMNAKKVASENTPRTPSFPAFQIIPSVEANASSHGCVTDKNIDLPDQQRSNPNGKSRAGNETCTIMEADSAVKTYSRSDRKARKRDFRKKFKTENIHTTTNKKMRNSSTLQQKQLPTEIQVRDDLIEIIDLDLPVTEVQETTTAPTTGTSQQSGANPRTDDRNEESSSTIDEDFI